MLCGINILCFVAGVLLPYEQRVLSRGIMHSDKSVKVGIPAPVNAVIDVIELCYLSSVISLMRTLSKTLPPVPFATPIYSFS